MPPNLEIDTLVQQMGRDHSTNNKKGSLTGFTNLQKKSLISHITKTALRIVPL